VIVDEIHSLAADKRGTHLSVSLERLENLTETSPTRIGCSATVEPLETIAEFLVGRESDGGPARPCEVVDTRFVRDYDLELVCPVPDVVGTPRHEVSDAFYARLHDWIQAHDTTLVFTNTRSGAERVLFNLRERYPDQYGEANAGCHHGSLSADVRQDVEERLKDGRIDVVTTSTSLELGIDMPTLDLVVQVGSPKSVASLLQRVGRAGHSPGDTVTGRVVALDRDDLVECSVMVEKATEGFVDRIFPPERAQDVAAQHVYGMAITSIEREADVKATLRRAYPYRDYSDAEWDQLLRYLTADYPGLEARNVYAKVWRDTNDAPDGEHHYAEHDTDARLIGRRGRLARVIYMQNVGTIPDSFSCTVLTRDGQEWVGSLDESYLDTLEPGDVVLLGGERYEYRYRRGSNVYVEPTDKRPTVPSWFSERLPLSYDLGRSILRFQADIVERAEAGGAPAVRQWLREFPIDENAVYALTALYDEQVRYAGPESISTPDRLVVERVLDQENYKRRYYVHSNYGRQFNDGLSRVVAHRCAERTDANVGVAVADHGFTLSMPLNRKVDPAAIIRDLEPADLRGSLRAALAETDLLQRYFRINATRALMILKQYKGHEKSAAKQQVTGEMLLGFAEALEDFAVLEETYRELLEDKLNVSGLRAVLEQIQTGALEVVSLDVASPSPRAFGLATLSDSEVVLAEDESAALQRFHQRVMREIEDGERTVPAGGD
ncbi:MAG: ATP-dependent helicase, partial [Halobacteriales archaeon]